MIKYECDNCGGEVYEPEAIGPEVLVETPNGAVQGKAYNFWWDAGVLTVEVAMSREGAKNSFCKACMWLALRDMLNEYAPTSWRVEVDNEERDNGVTVSDSKLLELHAEGTLPETSPDGGSEVPREPGNS